MSEKIIVLHPENQPEVDIYPIIKEGSIPNSVIDNQKIKSRTIINSNIALNTLKYEVLHSTLKELIDSKITQHDMENYLTSYYYNVEETQQYVGSEINTLHQTIQNEFYSNTTIDNMLMEKTDLSLFRQYLPGTFLDLTKQENNQTSKLNIHANGSIFLTNSGNKTNSGNYYLPNSIVKTEDAPNGYFVLSTTNDDYQSLYNLGAFDKITTNDDGTYTITRQTGYFTIEAQNIISTFTSGSTKVFCAETNIILPNAVTDWNQEFGTSNIGYKVISVDGNWISDKIIGGIGGQSVKIANNDFTTIDQFKSLCPIKIQYKMTTSYTEKVEKNHYATYNQDFILEHNKSEAKRSCNLLNTFDRSSIPWNSSLYNATLNSDGSYTSTATSDSRAWDYSSSDFKLRLTKGTYYFSATGTISTNTNTEIKLIYDNNNVIASFKIGNNYRGSFTLENDANVGILAKVYNSTNLKLMLNEGSVVLPYQAYEGKTIHEKDLGSYVTENNLKTINGNSIIGSGDLSVIADSVFTKLANTTSFTITNGTKYLVVAINKPVIVKGENTDHGNQGSKTCGGIFMVMMSNLIEGYGQDLYVNTERVFGDEYINHATISGDSFEIYRIN